MAGSGTLEDTQQTLTDHLKELRNRFFAIAFVLIGGASLAYVFREPILTALLAPLHGQELITLTPGGGFKFILNISIFTGLAVATPIAIYNLYGFMRPVMPKKVQRFAPLFLLLSLLLILGGAAFAYYLAIPGALRFLMEFSGGYVTASLTADSYLNFVIAYIAGLAIVFQVPLLLILIHWVHPLTPSGLMKSERWIILAAFIAAAIITPTPDPINQTLIALPVIVIYQFGVIAVLISVHRAKRQAKRRSPITSHEPRVHAVPEITPAPVAPTNLVNTKGAMDIIARPATLRVPTPRRSPAANHQFISDIGPGSTTSLRPSGAAEAVKPLTAQPATRPLRASHHLHVRQQYAEPRQTTPQVAVQEATAPTQPTAEETEAFSFALDIRDGLRPMTLE